MILQLTFWKALRAGAILVLAVFAGAEKLGYGFAVAGMAFVALLAGLLAGRGLPRIPRRSVLWLLLLLETASLPSLLKERFVITAPIVIVLFAMAFYCSHRTAKHTTTIRIPN